MLAAAVTEAISATDIVTWNDGGKNTYIEPSVDFGSTLDITGKPLLPWRKNT